MNRTLGNFVVEKPQKTIFHGRYISKHLPVCEQFDTDLYRYCTKVYGATLKIIYPELNSKEAIEQAKMTTLKNRREKLSQKLFTSIQENREHKLYHLLPEGNSQTYNLRELRRYKPIINTNRLKNSYIFNYASQS